MVGKKKPFPSHQIGVCKVVNIETLKHLNNIHLKLGMDINQENGGSTQFANQFGRFRTSSVLKVVLRRSGG